MEKMLWITYGKQYAEMAQDVLRAARIEEAIGDKAARIGIKPNLVVAADASRGATTHAALVEGIVEYLRKKGFSNLIILEGAWVGDSTDRAFSACGFTDLSRRTGVPLLDTQRDTHHMRDCAGMRLNLCDSATALEFLITVPVMKGHCQTGITCALKNLKGLIPDSEKRRFHTMGLHKPIAHLNAGIRQGFVLVDAICGDLNFEEGGNPVSRDQVYGGYDPVLCDTYACAQLGYATDEVPYIGMAASLGVGCDDLAQAKLVELVRPDSAKSVGQASRRVQALTKHVAAKDACSACYANLVYALEKRDGAHSGETIAIGQGYRGEQGKLGIGECCRQFSAYAKGCPPTATDILRFLEK